MSIAPEEFVSYINGALDGMVQIVEALGDECVNLRPNNMPHTNSPFAILTHCVGLTRYFIGTALTGRQIHRDRKARPRRGLQFTDFSPRFCCVVAAPGRIGSGPGFRGPLCRLRRHGARVWLG